MSHMNSAQSTHHDVASILSLQLEHLRSENLVELVSSQDAAASSRRNWLSIILSVSQISEQEGHSTAAGKQLVTDFSLKV